MSGVEVRVLVDGAYSAPDGRAIKAKKGDIIEVMGGPYVQSLRYDELVTLSHGKDEQQLLQEELEQLKADLSVEHGAIREAIKETVEDWGKNPEEPGGPSSPEEASKLVAKAVAKKTGRPARKAE